MSTVWGLNVRNIGGLPPGTWTCLICGAFADRDPDRIEHASSCNIPPVEPGVMPSATLAFTADRCPNCGEMSKFPPPAPLCADCVEEEIGIYVER